MGNCDIKHVGKWRFPRKVFSYERDVTLKQTNAFGNTYFANYIEWQGEAREKFLLQHPDTLIYLKTNPHIVLITCCVYHRYIENTFFGDCVRIEVGSRDILKYSFVLVFRYFNKANGRWIGEGWQKVCFRNIKTSLICEIPQLILDLIEPVLIK